MFRPEHKSIQNYIAMFSYSHEKLKEVSIPSPVYSASLIKDNSMFVCGGEDLKLYKYNYELGIEIGKYLIQYYITQYYLSSPGITNQSTYCVFQRVSKATLDQCIA